MSRSMRRTKKERAAYAVREAARIEDMASRVQANGGEPHYCTEKLSVALELTVRSLLLMQNWVGPDELREFVEEQIDWVGEDVGRRDTY